MFMCVYVYVCVCLPKMECNWKTEKTEKTENPLKSKKKNEQTVLVTGFVNGFRFRYGWVGVRVDAWVS